MASPRKESDAIRLGTKYQEQIRQFLLGETDFPQNGTIMLLISRLPRPHVVFSFPYTTRLDFNRHGHLLHIPGITFQLSLGGQDNPGATASCLVRSPVHPAYVSTVGDECVQRHILRLMGKTAPRWGAYPLPVGVV